MTNNEYDTGSDEDKSVIVLDTEHSDSAGQAHDINAKIDMLDGALLRLNSELDSIRDSVDEGLEKLGDTDLDLTSKVSDTYKRLGELDNTYKSLAGISADIHKEIGRLTGDISRVATRSSAELEKLEATSEVHNNYMAQQNEALADRVEKLVNDANETSTRLQLSIKDVQHSVLTTEQKLLVDIDQLAEGSQERDETLAKEIDKSNTEIEQQAARIIKLNKVDEALDKRARELEHTTTELGEDLGTLDDAIIDLRSRGEEMAENISQLQKASAEHSIKIGSLQSRFSSLAADLISLGDNERLHMRSALGLLLLVAAVLAGIYLNQEGSHQLLNERVADRAAIVDADMTAMQDRIGDNVDRQLTVINQDLSEKIIRLEDKVVEVDVKLQHLDDQAQSLNGRLSVDSPLDNFGGDNTIHGVQWLRELPKGTWMIQIATVRDSTQMYELAQSYSSYLQQPVAYYVDISGNNVMLYGRFDSEAAAAAAIRRLPYRMGEQYPSVLLIDQIRGL